MTLRILANYNGKDMFLDEVVISPLDRAYLFGDGLYEVIRFYHKRGWHATEHLERLSQNLRKMRMTCDLQLLQTNMTRLVETGDVENGIIYIQISRGTAPRTHQFPGKDVSPNVLVWTQTFDTTKHETLWKSGCSIITTPETRWAHPDIKTVNLLGNCLAKQQAYESNCFEAVFYDGQGFITEATASNVFIINASVIQTAPLQGQILPGVTRQHVLNLARKHQMSVQETVFSRDNLYTADEVFLTGTTTEVMPVIKADDRVIGHGLPGSVTKRLQEMFLTETRP